MKTSEKKTKLGQSLLKALKEILVSEGGSRANAGVSRQLIANDAQLKVTKDKIADLKIDRLARGFLWGGFCIHISFSHEEYLRRMVVLC